MVKFPKLYTLQPINVFIGHSNKDKICANNFFICLQKIVPFIPYMAEYYPNLGENYKDRIMMQLEQEYIHNISINRKRNKFSMGESRNWLCLCSQKEE